MRTIQVIACRVDVLFCCVCRLIYNAIFFVTSENLGTQIFLLNNVISVFNTMPPRDVEVRGGKLHSFLILTLDMVRAQHGDQSFLLSSTVSIESCFQSGFVITFRIILRLSMQFIGILVDLEMHNSCFHEIEINLQNILKVSIKCQSL